MEFLLNAVVITTPNAPTKPKTLPTPKPKPSPLPGICHLSSYMYQIAYKLMYELMITDVSFQLLVLSLHSL